MTVTLCVLDGWGVAPDSLYNAIYKAKPLFWNYLLKNYPYCELDTSAEAIGLPPGQVGNSEVGHMAIGSGRVIYHDLIRLTSALEHLEENIYFTEFIEQLVQRKGGLHILGLLSDGGVHSHINHIKTAIENIKNKYNLPIFLHAFLDGRDAPPRSALKYISKDLPITTLIGRYYAMDRDKRWERSVQALELIMEGKGEKFSTPEECIEHNYTLGLTDEFLLPAIIGNYAGYQKNDGILLLNFRADRMRQLLTLLLEDLKQKELPTLILGAVNYGADYNIVPSLLPPLQISNTLGEILDKQGLKQLRIAETEKYAHVTFFFNASKEKPFEKEERILVPSLKVATYDLAPEMSAAQITDHLVKAIKDKSFDFILVNYANADMVGHTGDMEATVKAIKFLDQCLFNVYKAVKEDNGILIVTSDHGNAEAMYNPTLNMPHTAHTLNKVPFLLISPWGGELKLKNGSLVDIAPTIIDLLHLNKPAEMEGSSLIEKL